MTQKKITIIGAGPAGLTAAYQLLKSDQNFQVTVYEQESTVGGLSKSYEFHGNTVDIGGHRYFSKNKYVNQLWQQILPYQKKGFLIRKRSSHIYFNRESISYPIQLSWETFRCIGLKDSLLVAISYLYSIIHKREVYSLEDFYINQFGKKLYTMFFRDYTEKLWGIPANQLSAEWGAQRIRKISLFYVLKKAFSTIKRHNKAGAVYKLHKVKDIRKDNEDKSFIDKFSYPAFGSGQFWENMASAIHEMGGTIQLNRQITGLESTSTGQYHIHTSDNQTEEADIILSSMPINNLINCMPGVPSTIKEISDGLHHRDMIVVAVEYNKKNAGPNWKSYKWDNWIYIQQKDIKFGRIQILNNWSPYACGEKDNLLLEVEYFCSKGDSLWRETDQALIQYTLLGLCDMELIKSDTVPVNTLIKRVQYAYPVYTGSYNRIDTLKKWLNQQNNLYCIGRSGQHHYNNMDHSMLTAVKAVECILDSSIKKETIWEINTDDAYHEEKQ